MKKTQFIDFLSTIKKTLVSFIAISVFIALGLGFYGGSLWSIDHTEQSLKQTYSFTNTRNLWVSYPFGASDEQIEQLKQIDGVDEVEGSNIVYRFFNNNENQLQQAAIVQITEKIDKLTNVEGELPTTSGQVAVLRSWANEYDVKIGDVITLKEENGVDYRQLQSVKTIANYDGDLFNLDVSDDDPGYLANNELTVSAIVDSAVYLSANPHAHGICSSNGLYIDAVFFVCQQEMPLEAFNGYTSILIYSEELSSLSSFSDEYKSLSKQLSQDVQKVVDSWDEKIVADFCCSVDEIGKQMDLINLQTNYSFAKGQQLYQQLLEIKDELVTQQGFSAVLETDSNNSFLVADNLMSVLKNLRLELGIAFISIGILICYSVISRLVADTAVQIGTKKALGFYRKEIMSLYLSYVFCAMLIGIILGVIIGVFVVEYGFASILADQFTFIKIPLVCDIIDILPISLIICAVIVLVTILACFSETNKKSITLLQGGNQDDKNYDFLQNSKVFGKLSLLNQTIILNMIRDKKRIFGMITGIAGAAALMVAGVSFYLNFTNSFTKQFEDYYHFDYQICFDSSNQQTSAQIRDILDDYQLDYAEIYTSCFIMNTPDGKTNAPNVIVPINTNELAKIMSFDIETNSNTSYDSGVWMSDYYYYSFDADVGSFLQLETLDGKEASLAVDHYYKYYLSTPVIMMSSDAYYKAFEQEVKSNSFYVDLNGLDVTEIESKLNDVDGYIYTIDVYQSFFASFESEKLVVSAFAILFIIMSILMMLMIIINLLNVYILEKKNELIILMINGYKRKFAKQYIYQDTIVLTLIGIIIGLVGGNFLAEKTLVAVEGTTIRMIHGINVVGCLIATLATIIITSVVCLISLKQVDRFKLSDIDVSNK